LPQKDRGERRNVRKKGGGKFGTKKKTKKTTKSHPMNYLERKDGGGEKGGSLSRRRGETGGRNGQRGRSGVEGLGGTVGN